MFLFLFVIALHNSAYKIWSWRHNKYITFSISCLDWWFNLITRYSVRSVTFVSQPLTNPFPMNNGNMCFHHFLGMHSVVGENKLLPKYSFTRFSKSLEFDFLVKFMERVRSSCYRDDIKESRRSFFSSQNGNKSVCYGWCLHHSKNC